MEWGDAVLLCFVGLALWTFIPRPARAGLGDLVHGAADAVRRLVRSVAPILSWLAYEVLLGVKRAPDVSSVSLPPPPVVMLREREINPQFPNSGEHGSRAMERSSEPPGTEAWNAVPVSRSRVATYLTGLSDDDLLDILAELPGDADGYRFADSRLAKFIGGRVEDRVAQVRALRGKEPPPKVQPGDDWVQVGQHSFRRRAR